MNVVSKQYDIHEGIIFVIELTPELHTPDLEGKSQLQIILENVSEVISELVITLPGTGIGCYLINYQGGQHDEIYPIFELQDLSLEMMKQLYQVLEDHTSGLNPLEKQFPIEHSKPLSASIFFHLRSLFYMAKTHKRTRRHYNLKKIFLFTNNDRPYNGNSQLRIPLKKTLADYNDVDITLIPFLLNKPSGAKFDKTEYSEILFYDKDARSMSIDEIRQRISRHKEIKRVYFTCPLKIANNLCISVKGYSMFYHETPRKIKFVVNEGSTFKDVETKSQFVDPTSGKEFSSEQLIKAYPLGSDAYIPLNPEQVKTINRLNDIINIPSLEILGFRDISNWLPQYQFGKASFVSPNNYGDFTHSQRTFSCLLQSMTKKSKFAVLFGTLKNNAAPRLFGMIPSTLPQYESCNLPQGFFLIKLPYLDDLRQLPPKIAPVDADLDELVPLFSNLIGKIHIKNGYQPQEYENPSLQWHFKMLRDDYLQLEHDINISDPLEKQRYINSLDESKTKIMKLRDYVQETASDSDPSTLANTLKELNQELNKLSNFDIMTNKKSKAPAAVDPVPTDDDIISAWKSGTLNGFKVDQLRKYVRARNNFLETATKKADLIANIDKFLQQKFKETKN
ncbi:hypothetical protein LJB42_002962 [Komagataella kurtzmanii]|nr:hypothetical protein LJB42_002962 [Komagataella kurtzmanii]